MASGLIVRTKAVRNTNALKDIALKSVSAFSVFFNTVFTEDK